MTLRLSLIAGAVAAFVALGLYAYHEHGEAVRQRARADAAVLQSTVDTSTAAITDRVASERVIIIQEGEEKAHAVEVIPSDDIPADILGGWRSGVRYSAEWANPDRPGELPATVPGAEP